MFDLSALWSRLLDRYRVCVLKEDIELNKSDVIMIQREKIPKGACGAVQPNDHPKRCACPRGVRNYDEGGQPIVE